jgi:prepilin-type N-terminal cleavage/methylation domain-containing protein
MRPGRSGFTLIELLIVIVVTGIMISIGSARITQYLAQQGARNARDEFVYMAARARAAAIERSQVVRLSIDPVNARAFVVTNRSGAGDTLEIRHYDGEFRAEVTTSNGAPVTVCYSPRGYAIQTCNVGVGDSARVNFKRGASDSHATVRPLGQVVRP